jgi:hypothetical protein
VAPPAGFGGGRGGFGGAAESPIPGVGMNVTPMATATQAQRISPYEPEGGQTPENLAQRPSAGEVSAVQQGVGGGGRGGRGGAGSGGQGGPGGGAAAGPAAPDAPRVVLQFPASANDMLLSGTLAGGQALANRAQLVDIPLGQGHVVSFAIRPFWRWQTQGTYFLAFNAILNWNDLNAGRTAPAPPPTTTADR